MDLSQIYLVANTGKPGAAGAMDRVTAWARERRIDALELRRPLPAADGGEHRLVLALGGDGTVLRAASLVACAGTPILGINLGSLGFLTQASAEGLDRALGKVLDGEFVVEDRMRLSFRSGDRAGTALNDLVITGGTASHFCELELWWAGGVVTSYPGDGLIFSTATGSTAYNLSAGGPVIVPPADCILATPLAAHRLGVRPVVFPTDADLEVVARTGVRMVADGDAFADVPRAGRVHVTRAETPTRLVRLIDAPTFFDVLDEKLNWADSRSRACGD